MKRAAVYCRVSTPSQVDGFSLGTQLDQLVHLAETRGYRWEDFCDPGISGEKLEEPTRTRRTAFPPRRFCRHEFRHDYADALMLASWAYRGHGGRGGRGSGSI